MLYDYKQSGCPKFIGVTTLFDTETTITWQITHFFVYLMKFDIEFMIIKPLRRTHVRIGNG